MTRPPPGTPVMFIVNQGGTSHLAPAKPGDLQDWTNLSYRLAPIGRWLPLRTQRVGFLDFELRQRNLEMTIDLENLSDAEKTNAAMAFTSWQFSSELWVFAAYELVRNINANVGDFKGGDAILRNRWAALKKEYEAIRIPLAKFRSSGARRDVAVDIAYPVVPGDRGAGWLLDAGLVVWRDDIALELRETIRACPEVPGPAG